MGLLEAQQYLLKSMREEKATQGAQQSEPRPQSEVNVARHRHCSFPHPAARAEGPVLGNKQSDQWSLEFKILILQETENIWVMEEGTLQSETR